ncbi:MAG: secretin N-terminal domain-containing protein [Gammaproteobacteria bacterium]|nr:secretin N-terminal domain-containing protein [Gammaproteobacteria bacterium]
MGATSALESKYHELGSGNARSVTVVEAGDRTRVIVNLVDLVTYDTEARGDRLVIRVGTEGADAGGAVAATSPAPARDVEPVSGGRIEDIDFRRGREGCRAGDRDPVRSEGAGGRPGRGRQHLVEFPGTSLPKELQRRLDVTDFATPVRIVDAVEEAGHTVITVRPEGRYEYLAYQADNTLIVNVSPPVDDESPGRGEDAFKYTGEKLSLNFQDIEVRSVLQLIADFTDLNLVASDTVSGRITLRLQNVPWDQALDIVLRTKGLDKRRMGNVLMVAPAAEIAAREKQELDNKRQIEELAPLRTEFLQVRYANAQDMVSLFQAAGEGEASLLSDRGNIMVDERTNSIIISETADRLTQIRRILQQLDIPVRQVQIEARIVTANTNFTRQLGIRWGGARSDRADDFLRIGGNLDTTEALQGAGPDGGVGGIFADGSHRHRPAGPGCHQHLRRSVSPVPTICWIWSFRPWRPTAMRRWWPGPR